jgi:hypothetical protein
MLVGNKALFVRIYKFRTLFNHMFLEPNTVAARSKKLTVFARLKAGIVGSNPTKDMDVCVCVYSMFMLSCMQAATFRRADHSSKDSYRLCIVSRNWKRGQCSTKSCRAIIIIIITTIIIIIVRKRTIPTERQKPVGEVSDYNNNIFLHLISVK